jgi:putative endonuclease
VRIFVYMLRCADGSYYVGTARGDLERRVMEHDVGRVDGYTARRRPVSLVWQQEYEDPVEAIAAERQLKGWSRRKKEALISGDFPELRSAARRRGGAPKGE